VHLQRSRDWINYPGAVATKDLFYFEKSSRTMSQALVIIDVQQALFNPVPTPYRAHEVIENLNLLTEKARTAGVPVIWVLHETPNQDIMRYQSSGWQLPASLNVAVSDLQLRKTTPDSFLRTQLEQMLHDKGVTELIIGGYATEFCVDTTIRSAAAKGFHVTLVEDAHCTHDKPHASAELIIQHHNATLPQIRSFGVTIQTRTTAETEFNPR
jgi:nicotinamidase-related amidase